MNSISEQTSAKIANAGFLAALPIVAVVVARRLSPRLVRFAFGGR